MDVHLHDGLLEKNDDHLFEQHHHPHDIDIDDLVETDGIYWRTPDVEEEIEISVDAVVVEIGSDLLLYVEVSHYCHCHDSPEVVNLDKSDFVVENFGTFVMESLDGNFVTANLDDDTVDLVKNHDNFALEVHLDSAAV